MGSGRERKRKLGRRCFDDALSTGLVFCIGCFIKGRDKIKSHPFLAFSSVISKTYEVLRYFTYTRDLYSSISILSFALP